MITTIGILLCVAAGGVLYGQLFAPAVMAEPSAFAVPRADLSRYGAMWASYVVPPVQHPFLGEAAGRIWNELGVREGMLEQQLSLGFAILALGAVAVWPSKSVRREGQITRRGCLLLLTTVAIVALVCSMAPDRRIGDAAVVWPSILLHDTVPMFRAYARFGVVVQLMAALLAGIGVDRLLSSGARGKRVGGIALVTLALGEYAVWPPALSRDVLPTTAHRWVVDQPDPLRVLDCVELTSETASIPWMTHQRVSVMGSPFDDCAEPNLAEKLAANGYTHLLLRHDAPTDWRLPRSSVPYTVRTERLFADAELLAIAARAPSLYTLEMQGFHPREHDRNWTWRWMGSTARWTIVNRSGTPIMAAVESRWRRFRATVL